MERLLQRLQATTYMVWSLSKFVTGNDVNISAIRKLGEISLHKDTERSTMVAHIWDDICIIMRIMFVSGGGDADDCCCRLQLTCVLFKFLI